MIDESESSPPPSSPLSDSPVPLLPPPTASTPHDPSSSLVVVEEEAPPSDWSSATSSSTSRSEPSDNEEEEDFDLLTGSKDIQDEPMSMDGSSESDDGGGGAGVDETTRRNERTKQKTAKKLTKAKKIGRGERGERDEGLDNDEKEDRMRLSFPDPLTSVSPSPDSDLEFIELDVPTHDGSEPSPSSTSSASKTSSRTKIRRDLDNSILVDGGAYSLLLDAPTSSHDPVRQDESATSTPPPPASRDTLSRKKDLAWTMMVGGKSPRLIVRAKPAFDPYSSSSPSHIERRPVQSSTTKEWVRSTLDTTASPSLPRVVGSPRSPSTLSDLDLDRSRVVSEDPETGTSSLMIDHSSSVDSSQTVVPSIHVDRSIGDTSVQPTETMSRSAAGGGGYDEKASHFVKVSPPSSAIPSKLDLISASLEHHSSGINLNRVMMALTVVGVALIAVVSTLNGDIPGAKSLMSPEGISRPVSNDIAKSVIFSTATADLQPSTSSLSETKSTSVPIVASQAVDPLSSSTAQHRSISTSMPFALVDPPPPRQAIDPPSPVSTLSDILVIPAPAPSATTQSTNAVEDGRAREESWKRALEMRRKMEEHALRCRGGRGIEARAAHSLRDVAYAGQIHEIKRRGRSSNKRERRRRMVLDLVAVGEGNDQQWIQDGMIVQIDQMQLDSTVDRAVEGREDEGIIVELVESLVRTSRGISQTVRHWIVDFVEPIRPRLKNIRHHQAVDRLSRLHRKVPLPRYPVVQDYVRTTHDRLFEAFADRAGRQRISEWSRGTLEFRHARKALDRLYRQIDTKSKDITRGDRYHRLERQQAIIMERIEQARKEVGERIKRVDRDMRRFANERVVGVGATTGKWAEKEGKRHVRRAARTVERAKRKVAKENKRRR